MKPNEAAKAFAKKYGDKAVWQVDTLLVSLARIIELEMILPMYQGGDAQKIIKAELDQLKKTVLDIT